MNKIYNTIIILLILPIFGSNSPIELNDFFPPEKLYHDNSIISHINNNNNLNKLNKNENYEEINYRLPNNTIPISYFIKLTTHVHLKKLEFTGINEITLKALNESDTITLHGRNITINDAKLVEKLDPSKKIIIIDLPTEPADKNEFLVFKLEKNLTINKEYILTVNYKSKLRNDNGGFYLSKYQNKDNETIYIATTQFESTDARHGFPCYDEPGIKANFTIEITHGNNFTALSNMPVEKTIEGSKGYNITTFKTTAKMSPYLVAFVISNFDGTFTEVNNLRHGVYSRPDTQDERVFPLEASTKILHAIENYVNYNYSFPKMDQISIPDFAAGAMENWGLVTYREEMLLYHPNRSTIKTKTVVANTIAHEYGHQWFGNLVSPKWWTYLWLNEGFASIFAYIGVELAYPEWGIMEHFIVSEYQRALKSDEGIQKRPMTHYVDQPKQIVGLFDSVSYSKAACVIQMIRHYVGEDTFKTSLNNYLKRMEYKSAEENDLFESFQIGAKINGQQLNVKFEELMGSWSRQGGFPLLTVHRDYKKGNFIVEQNGFKNDGENGDDKRKWIIPFNFVTAKNSDFGNTKPTHLINSKNYTVDFNDTEKISENDWLILNKQLTGYYRVNYDDKNWDLIIKQLKKDPKKIHTYNRAQLIFDSYRFSLNKMLKIEKFFDLMEYLPKETEYSPWSSVDEAFSFYKNRFHDNKDIYKNLQLYILKNVEKIYKQLGVKDNSDDHHFTKYIRNIAINWACAAGSKECLDNTHKRLSDFVNDNNKKIEANLQQVIYCNGLKKSNDKEFEFMFNSLFDSKDQAERQLIMYSLGCSHNNKHLEKFVNSSIGENNLRPQERVNVLKSAYSKTTEGFEAAVQFLMNNFKAYSELVPAFGSQNPLDVAVKELSKIVVSQNQKDKLSKLVKEVKGTPGIDDNLENIVNANADINMKWLKENELTVKDYLVAFAKRNSGTQLFISFTALMLVIFVSVKNIF